MRKQGLSFVSEGLAYGRNRGRDMNVPEILVDKVRSSNSQNDADTQLGGYKLTLARTGWVVLAVTALALWVVELPPGYAQYLTVCRKAVCPNQQPTPEMVQALNSAGLSLQFYAIYLTTLSVLWVLIFCAIGAIIAWRKSRDWMALLVSLTLVILGPAINTDYQQLATIYPITQLPGELLQFLMGTLPLLVGYLFPNGRFVPRWTRWLALPFILFAAAGSFFPISLFNNNNWPGPLTTVLSLAVFGSLLFAQIYRYFRVSTPVQKQQSKWVVFGIMATIIYFITLLVITTLNPAYTTANSLGSLFGEATYFLAVLIVPLAIAFSILRYRLWDIDLLINRTLVYTILTGVLALIYFGCVFLLQTLVGGLTGQAKQSPLIIVGSTLAIAVLFQPLRTRIQAIINRRFYRRNYDAARTLAAFSATLRNEMDLGQLHEHVVAVVQETMQPTHVSLWLRPLQHERKRSTGNAWRDNAAAPFAEN
jgi:hypothetical protein